MSDTLEQILDSAAEELRDRIEDGEEADDLIFEIADSMTPVYNAEILDIASENSIIAYGEPDCGPAFDGSPTLVNIAAANIYEAIAERLQTEARQIEDEREDDDE